MNFFQNLAVDLGSSNTRVYSTTKGLILNEPSVVSLNRAKKEVLAVGNEAKSMIGRTPADIESICPIQHGTVTDLIAIRAMFKYFLKAIHAQKIHFLRPGLVICIPYGLTDMERRVLVDVAIQSGFSENGTHLLEQSVAAAVAAGMDISTPVGNMIIDVGGGKTEVSVVSMGGVVTSKSTNFGGKSMDEQIIKFAARELGVVIGEVTAEQIKIRIADAYFDPKAKSETMEIKGRNERSGLPRITEITNFQASMAIRETVDAIAETTITTLEHTPPELSADIIKNGIVLTGGGSLLRGLDKVLTEKTGLKVHLMEDPACAVVNGADMVLGDLNKYKNTLVPLAHLL